LKIKLLGMSVNGMVKKSNVVEVFEKQFEDIVLEEPLSKADLFRVFEKVVPDLTGHMWMEEEYCGGETFKGRTVEQRVTEIGMKFLLKEGVDVGVGEKLKEDDEKGEPKGRSAKDLLLWREGKGRLYYRISLNYAPQALNIKPFSRGFTVFRTYSAAKTAPENKEDVVSVEPGVWIVKKGALVQVNLQMKTEFPVNHVALVDYLPAGFEALNIKLKGTVAEDDEKKETTGNTHWYIHQNIRDERVEVFARGIGVGVFEYEFTARATTIGQFIAPPCKAEEMYTPDIVGHSSSAVVTIE